MDVLRRIFWVLNKVFMVPVFKLGLGALVCNPLTGYIMVIRTVGRKSGKQRFTPVNYAIKDGYIYCMAGFGRKAHWYLNLRSNPQLEVILPGRALAGEAQEVSDPDEALWACKQVSKNAGFAGFMEGFNPWTAADERFLRILDRNPMMKIRLIGVGSGPTDAGGWHWLTLVALTVAAIIWFVSVK